MKTHQGISFTEFTYQLLQAYDFYHLYNQISCTIQVGGSDQWGNILAGLDLIQRIRGEDCEDGTSPLPNAFGITTPLLTTSSGEKFGKSAGNAIWLDPKLTSVFEFYQARWFDLSSNCLSSLVSQFFLKAVDADVDKYLRMLTLLPLDEIKTTMKEHQVPMPGLSN